jgi:hypothetical protein
MAAGAFIAGDVNVADSMQPPGASGISSMRAGVSSLSESHKLIGSKFTGREGAAGSMALYGGIAGLLSGAGMGASIGSFLGPIGTGVGAVLGGLVGAAAGGIAGMWAGSGQEALNKAIGQHVDTEAYQKLGDDIFAGDEDSRKKALLSVDKSLAKLQRGEGDPDRTRAEEAQFIAESGLKLGSMIDDAMKKEGVDTPDKLSKEAKQRIGDMGKKFGAKGWEDSKSRGMSAAAVTSGKAQERRAQHIQELKEEATEKIGNFIDAGVFTKNEDGKLAVSGKAAELFGAGGEALKILAAKTEAAAGGKLEEFYKQGDRFTEQVEGMGAKDKLQLEKTLAGTAEGRQLTATRKGEEGLKRGLAGGGLAGGIKAGLGMAGIRGIKSEDLARMLGGKDKEAGMKELMGTAQMEGGLTSEESRSAFKAGVTALQAGNTTEAQKQFSNKALQQETSAANEKKSMAKAESENPIGKETNKLLKGIDVKLKGIEDLKEIKQNTNQANQLLANQGKGAVSEALGI